MPSANVSPLPANTGATTLSTEAPPCTCAMERSLPPHATASRAAAASRVGSRIRAQHAHSGPSAGPLILLRWLSMRAATILGPGALYLGSIDADGNTTMNDVSNQAPRTDAVRDLSEALAA